jgi:hypothetical protein
MMFEPDMMAWAVYIVASLLLTVFGWLITRNWRPQVLARILRVWVAVLVLTPAYVEPGSAALAPAWAVTLFALLGDGMAEASHGYVPLLAALAIATALIAAGAIVQLFKERHDIPREPVRE